MGNMQASIRLPKLAFQESIAAKKVNTVPKKRSTSPIGLKRFASRTPRVNPMTAGSPHKNGRGVKLSLTLTCIQEYPKDPNKTVNTPYRHESIVARVI